MRLSLMHQAKLLASDCLSDWMTCLRYQTDGDGMRSNTGKTPLSFLERNLTKFHDDNPFGLAKPEYETGDAQVAEIQLYA